MSFDLRLGDALEVLSTLEAGTVQTCVTSPPYFGLRDYGAAGQIGLEPTVDEYVQRLVSVFAEVRRALRPDGTLWLNLGDSYAMTTRGAGGDGKQHTNAGSVMRDRSWRISGGLKPKDLIGVPWRVAFALQADGWYLRSDIIWHKPNPMPESVTDRPTSAHEHVFLLAKSERYHYDADAIAEPAVSEHGSGFARDARLSYDGRGSSEPWVPRPRGGVNAFRGQAHIGRDAAANREGRDMSEVGTGATRNARNVWTIATQPFSEAHFATMPPELARRCILAGSRPGDVVLDPFAGAGTTLLAALQLDRRALGIELNPDYADIARRRLAPLTCQDRLLSEVA